MDVVIYHDPECGTSRNAQGGAFANEEGERVVDDLGLATGDAPA